MGILLAAPTRVYWVPAFAGMTNRVGSCVERFRAVHGLRARFVYRVDSKPLQVLNSTGLFLLRRGIVLDAVG